MYSKNRSKNGFDDSGASKIWPMLQWSMEHASMTLARTDIS